MNRSWPEWALLRAEEVAELPPERRGPWESDRRCQVIDIKTRETHPAEEPYSFHCRTHLVEVRKYKKVLAPWPSKDTGKCITCGRDADLHPVTMADRVACVQAEQTNSTVVRIKTKRFCKKCESKKGSKCRGKGCRGNGKPNKIREANCCPITRSGDKRHCSRCCKIIKQDKIEKQNQTLEPRIAPISGTSRKKAKDIPRSKIRNLSRSKIKNLRRSKIKELRGRGLNTHQMAEELNVSETTIRTDVNALKSMTKAAQEAMSKKTKERKEAISQMHEQGLSKQEIADAVGITEGRIHNILREAGYIRPRQTKKDPPGTDKGAPKPKQAQQPTT